MKLDGGMWTFPSCRRRSKARERASEPTYGTRARRVLAALTAAVAVGATAGVPAAVAWDSIPGLSSHTAITEAAVDSIINNPNEPPELRAWVGQYRDNLVLFAGSIVGVRAYGELVHRVKRPVDVPVDGNSCPLPDTSLGSTPVGPVRWSVGNNPGMTHPEYWWQTVVCLYRSGHEAQAADVLGQLLHAIEDQGSLPHATYLMHGGIGEDQGFEYLSTLTPFDTTYYRHPDSLLYPGKDVLDIGDHADDAAAQFAIPKHVADWRAVRLAPRDADPQPAVLQATSPTQIRIDVSVAELTAMPVIEMRATYERADGTLGTQERTLSLNGVTWQHWTITDDFAPNGRVWLSFRRPEQGVVASTGQVQVYVTESKDFIDEVSKPVLHHPWEYVDWLREWTQWVLQSPYWRRYYPALNVEGDLGFDWLWASAPNAERAILTLQWRASQLATIWAIEDAYRLLHDPNYTVAEAQGSGYRVALYADHDYNSSGDTPEDIISYSVGCEPYADSTCGSFPAPVPHDPTPMVGDGLFRATGTGSTVTMKADDLLGSFLRDRISSVEVRGAKLLLYPGVNLTGTPREYTGDTKDLGDFNDKARSARIIPLGVDAVPTARDDTASTAFGQATSIPILANDDPATLADVDVVLHQPRRGSVTMEPDGQVRYVPDPGFSGSDSFHYELASKGTHVADSAIVSVDVSPGPTTGEQVHWTGQGDAWSWGDAANWYPRIPEYGDSVTIGPDAHVEGVPDGTVLSDLTLNAALLRGGSLTVTGNTSLVGAPENTGGLTRLTLTRLTITGSTSVQGYVYVDRSDAGPSIVNWGQFSLMPGSVIDDGRLDNRGSIIGPSSGTATLSYVELTTHGSFSVPPGGTIELTIGNATFSDGIGFRGGGRIVLGDGQTATLGKNLTVGAGTTLELRGAAATLLGTGNFVGSGTFAWTGGWMMGHLDVPATVQTDISGPEQKRLAGEDPLVPAVLNLAGPTTFSGGGQLNFVGGNGVLNSSGTFTMLPGTEILGTNGTFSSSGALIVPSSSSGTATMIDLEINDSGPVTVGNGSTLALTGGKITPAADVAIDGGGTVKIDGGESLSLASNLSIGSNTTLALAGAAAGIRGTGNFVGSGTFSWTAGWITGHLDVPATVQTDISGPEQKRLTGEDPLVPAVLNLAGPTTFSGSGQLNFVGGNSVLNNFGTFTMLPGTEILGTNGTFSSSGALIVPSSSSGTATMTDLKFNNSGSVTVGDGSTLDLTGASAFSQTGGMTELRGGTLSSAGPIPISGGALSGYGTVSGSVVSSGIVKPSATGGTLKIAGAFTQTSAGTLEVHIVGANPLPGNGSGQLDVTGEVALDGEVRLLVTGGFEALDQQRIRALNYGSRSGEFAVLSGDRSYRVAYEPTGADLVFTVPTPAPVSTAPPSISGTAVQGQTLTEGHGTWANGPTSYSYQWERCDIAGTNCQAIAGATSQTYTLSGTDVGRTIRVQESASNAGGTGGPVNSAATGVVKPIGPPVSKPQVTLPPVISGTAIVAQKLKASTGAWTGTPPLTFSYQWQRCNPRCVSIRGATAGFYTATSADLGSRLRVLVTAANRAGSAQAQSGLIGPVTPAASQIKAQLLKQLAPAGKNAKIGTLLKKGRYTFSLKTLSSGRVVIDWYYLPKGARLAKAKPVLVATGKVNFAKAGVYKITVKLTSRGKQLLKPAKNLKLTAKGTYTPTARRAVVATRSFTLKR